MTDGIENTKTPEQLAVEAGRAINYKFNFKSRKITNEAGEEIGRTKKQESVIATLPVPSSEEIINYLSQPDSAVAKLIRDAVSRIVVDAARDQFDEVIDGFGDDASKSVTAGHLDYDKLTLDFISTIPPSQRGGTALTDDDWKSFFEDYLAVMVQVTGKEEKRIKNHIDLFKKPQKAKSAKDVLQVLIDQLDIYMASSANLEDTAVCAERLRNRFDKWLTEPEKTIDKDLL